MDALRKAEAEKKAAAAREAGAEVAANEGASLSISADELRLEPLLDPSLDRSSGRSGESTNPDYPSAQRLNMSGRYRAGDATLADELTFDHPFKVGTRSSVRDGSLSRPELVTAHTVIKATGLNGVNPAFIASFALVLLMIAALGGYAYYYYRHLPLAPSLPSPRVLDAIEVPKTPPVAVTPIVIEPVLAPPEKPAEAPLQIPDLEREMTALANAAPTPPSAATAPVPQPPAPPSTDTEITTGAIRIARTAPAPAVNGDLNRAYAAFVAGDLARAELGYQQVLARAPRQVDAWLGLASIAAAKGDLKNAHQYYSRVLSEDPTSAAAIAGLALIEGNRSAASETKLKLLLDQGHDEPYLHFALGNLYASSQRWPDAQQAFFEAYRGNPQSPDYAFNLAVCLEHLGQPRAALEYYRKAQTLQATHPATFATTVVARRIDALAAP